MFVHVQLHVQLFLIDSFRVVLTCHHVPNSSAERCPQLAKYQHVHEGCRFPIERSCQAVLVAEFENLLKAGTSLLHCLRDGLVHPVQDQWDCSHDSGLQDGHITLESIGT